MSVPVSARREEQVVVPPEEQPAVDAAVRAHLERWTHLRAVLEEER
ncbi:hypothetical protein QE405_003341 [Nocardioides zeae]|uniref:Uncharacterized protein n=1 Tax=Nocardioides zeae TaxID=1457234 RepID=A0AAJ1X4Y3_9ACTN|nr:hypothetical protein [Nocardioides zeae]